MAASKSIIPRHLLPIIHRHHGLSFSFPPIMTRRTLFVRRYASSSSSSSTDHDHDNDHDGHVHDSDKPIVLEKPLKFNPPSHGNRLRTGPMPRHYQPPLTKSEVKIVSRRHYPGMMAPPGSWEHWFWHSKRLHLNVCVGILLSLAIFTIFAHYNYNTSVSHLVPELSDLWHRPLHYVAAWYEVVATHERNQNELAQKQYIRHLNDFAKRQYYMKVHGIEPINPIKKAFGLGQDDRSLEELEAEVMGEGEGEGKADGGKQS